ncbi:MAG: transketolase [Deltaproteobacteria bacterium]|nr:transketolase [Deltaproteobacteria bacterium]MBW2306692.1 transketolase [Deltaproteobacteria bacterium]
MLQRLDASPFEMRRIALTLRMHILKMIAGKGKGHTGPALSIADIMTALYFGVLNVDPEDPHNPGRDRFILSKGHACTALYAALAERGYFPGEKLDEYYELDSYLGGHPVKGLPGVEAATGSLGHGLPISVGLALAAKFDGHKHRVFTLLGDGEVQEGSVWEAAMAAAHFRLDNLVAVVDRNNLGVDGYTEELMALEPLEDKWRSFRWEVRTVDGHDPAELVQVLRSAPFASGKPSIVLALTTKGKGIDFVENRVEWHHKAPDPQQAEEAFRQLRAQMDALEREIES